MMENYEKNQFFKIFIFALLLCLGGGWLTGLITQSAVHEWYPRLIKPSGTPPNYVFPIAWTLLYSLMAISLTMLFTSHTKDKAIAYCLFGIQLGLNFLWSWIFFYLRRPDLALFDVIALWIFILLTILAFWRHTHLGSYLLLPYLAWVSYAFYLNFFIVMLN